MGSEMCIRDRRRRLQATKKLVSKEFPLRRVKIITRGTTQIASRYGRHLQAPTSPRHLRSPRGRPYLHSFGELRLGRDGILKAVHRASTLPGSLSAVRSNPSSSSLFYSIAIILHAKAGSVNSRFSKFRKAACSVKQSIFASETFNILFYRQSLFLSCHSPFYC